MKYRKKPVVIDAVIVDPMANTPDWFRAAMQLGMIRPDLGRGGYVISTLEGDMHARRGDMIIRGVKGELYPCKPDIFAATYEPA